MNHRVVLSSPWDNRSGMVGYEICARRLTTVTPMALEMRLAMIKAFLMRKRAYQLIGGSSKGASTHFLGDEVWGICTDVSRTRTLR